MAILLCHFVFPETYSYGAPGGGVKATITAAPATVTAPLPMDNVKELMMKLIAENPSYLTSGIPNELLTQMLMTSSQTTPSPVPSPRPMGVPRQMGVPRHVIGGPRQMIVARPAGFPRPMGVPRQMGMVRQTLVPVPGQNQRILMTPGDAMKVKPQIGYNVCFFCFSFVAAFITSLAN